jgi:hypothetical protein
LGDRLALFQRHRNRHRFDALAHELHGLEDDLGSLGRRGARPRFEAPLSGSQRIIQIGTAGVRDDGQSALIGWVDHWLAVGLSPLTGDVQFEVGIVGYHQMPSFVISIRV